MLRSFLQKTPAYAVWRAFRDPPFEPITKRIALALPRWGKQTVIQVGTNDGKRDDPVSPLLKNRPLWRGLLVEPLPLYMEQLKTHYGSAKRFSFEQAAIGSEDGNLPFYHIDERARQSRHWLDYFDRIGSLSRDSVLLNLGDRAVEMLPYILESKINVISFSTLVRKWNITKVDALIVDAEGHDWNIVKQALSIDIQPKVIVFEHTHMKESILNDACAILRGNRYNLEKIDRDLLCIRN